MSKNKSHGNGLEQRDPESGQFVMGHTGIGGRPKGSRNQLGEAFIADLYEKWQKHGADVLVRVIRDDPAQFLKTVAAVLPKQLDETLNLNVSLLAEARNFDEAFAFALRHIGSERLKLIEVDGDELGSE